MSITFICKEQITFKNVWTTLGPLNTAIMKIIGHLQMFLASFVFFKMNLNISEKIFFSIVAIILWFSHFVVIKRKS